MSAHTRIPKDTDLSSAAWYKSTYSNGTGNNCVEVADLAHTSHRSVAIRDSKQISGPALLIEPAGFAAFVAGIRSGHVA